MATSDFSGGTESIFNAPEPEDERYLDAARDVREDPGALERWDALEDWAGEANHPDPIARLYWQALEAGPPADVATELAQRAVGFHEEWYGEGAPVLLSLLRKILESDPSSFDWAFPRLTVAYTSSESWDELLSLYDAEIERNQSDAERATSLLEEAIQTAKDFANAPDRAIDYLIALLEYRPGDPSLEEQLRRLLERQERWLELIGLLRTRIGRLGAAEGAPIRFEIAALYLDRVGAIDEAIEEIRALMNEGMGDTAITALLERITEIEGCPAELKREAFTLLRARYSDEGRSEEVVQLISASLSIADEGEQLILHREAATKLAKTGDAEQAFAHLEDALRLRVEDEETRALALEIALATGDFTRYIGVLSEVAEGVADSALRAVYYADAARAAEESLGDRERAAAFYERVIAEPEVERELARGVYRRLIAIHSEAERFEEQLRAVEGLSALEQSIDARRKLFFEAAKLSSKLGEKDRAIAALRARLSDEPADDEARGLLIDTLRAAERWEELIEALRTRIEGSESAFQIRMDLFEIASVERDRLERLGDAIATFHQIAERFGEDAEVVDALASLYEAAERYEELASLLDRAAQREGDHLAEVRCRIGEVYERYLGRPLDAVRAFAGAIEGDPRSELARQGLARLADLPETHELAIEGLARAYLAADEWEPVVALLEERLSLAKDDATKILLLKEAAKLQEDRAGAHREAIVSLGRALSLDPEDERIEADLLRLGALVDEADALVSAIAGAAEATNDPLRRAHFRNLEGELREERLKDDAGAFEAYRDAFALSPRDELGAKIRRLGQGERLHLAEESLRNAASDESVSDVLLGLYVEVLRETKGDALFAALGRYASRFPTNLDLYAELAEIAPENERLDALRELFERASGLFSRGASAKGELAPEEAAIRALDELISLLGERGEAREQASRLIEGARLPIGLERSLEYRRRAASIFAKELGDRSSAIDLYRDILRDAPEDAESFRALGELLEEEGRFPELLDLRKREIALTEDRDRRIELRLDLARLVDRIEREGGRIEALRANLVDAPGHMASIEALDDVLRRYGRFEELADLLSEQAASLSGSDARALYGRLAEIARFELEDRQRAIEAYRRVVEIEAGPDALDALAELHIEQDEHAAAARWLERRLAITSDEEKSAISLLLARSLIAAGREDRVPEVLEAARALDPSNAEIRTLLAERYREDGAHAPLAKLLADATEFAKDDVRLALAKEAASLYFDTLHQPKEAIPMFRIASELDREDKGARLSLAEALRATGALDEAKEVLTELAGEFGRRRTPERAQVHYLLGQVARAEGDLETALEEVETATKMAMSNAPMLATLGALAREAGQLDRSEKAYRTLLMLVRRRPPEDAIDVGVGEVLYELHDIANERGEGDKAKELLEGAIEAVAQSTGEALRFVEALSAKGKASVGLEGIDARLAQLDADAADRAELLHASAHALEVTLNRPDEALERRMEALAIEIRDESGLDRTRRLARDAGRSSELIDLLHRGVDGLRRAEDAPWVAKLYLLIAEIAEEDLGDLAIATNAAEKALTVEGEHQVGARLRLASLARARGDVETERELRRGLLSEELPPREAGENRYRLAELSMNTSEEETLALLKDAYAAEPLLERALPIIRTLASVEGAGQETLAFFGSLARESGDDALLLEYLERVALRDEANFEEIREAAMKAVMLEAHERAETLLHRAASFAEESGERSQANWAYRTLALHHEGIGDLKGAIEWSRRALATVDDDLRIPMQIELAEMARRPGGDLEVSAALYRELYDEGERERDIYLPLLDVLAELDDEAGHTDMVAILLDALIDIDARNEVRVRRAHYLLSKEERHYDAIDVLKDALDDQPEHAEAGALLTKIYEDLGYDEDLVELLHRKLDIAFDQDSRDEIVETSLKLGSLLGKVNPDDAVEIYRRALDRVRDDAGLIDALLALLGEDIEEDERLELLELRLGTQKGAEASALARELLAHYEAEGDAETALRILDLGFRANPSDDELRERLEATYRELDRRGPMAAFLLIDAKRLLSSDREAALERAYAGFEIFRDEVGSPEDALPYILELAQQSEGDGAISDLLIDAYQAAGRLNEAREVLGRELASDELSSERRVELYRLRARVHLGLSLSNEAVQDLEAAYELDSEGTVEELILALGEGRDAALSVSDRERFRALSFRLIELLNECERGDESREALAHYLSIEPSDEEALRRLIEVDTAIENWAGVAWACARLVEISEGEAQVEAVLALADASEAAGTPADARGPLESVLASQPSEPRLRERLKEIYKASGAYLELAEIELAEAALAPDDETRFELYRHAGELFVGAGEYERALMALEAAYGIHPEDHRTVVALIDARTASGQLAEAGALLESAIENHPKRRSPELSELQHRMARLASVGGDRRLEMDWLNQALLTDKQNLHAATELAELAMELGEYDTAMEALRAITLSKVDGPMSRAMAFLKQAQISHERGESRRALLWARKARTEDPELQEAVDFLRELGES